MLIYYRSKIIFTPTRNPKHPIYTSTQLKIRNKKLSK